MRVLVACEYSGRVRDAFIKKGHIAVSCDLLDTEQEGPHYKGDVFDIINDNWDLMIAHPPCTYLCSSGARWWKDEKRQLLQKEAIAFVLRLYSAPIDKIAIENPIGILSTAWKKPSQIIQPWQFGHGETKATCLWLKNLPLLKPSDIVEGRYPRIHRMSGKNRGKLRSLTYQGIADALAEQYG